MQGEALARLALLFCTLAMAGCAATGRPVAAFVEAPVELTATPFFPQERYQCGPAALATVLAASGVPVRADDLVDQVYLPGRQGSLQAELLAATRRHDRIPYVLPPRQTALAEELRAGRPVLVMQNLGVSLLPRWHYAVVVGMEPEGDDYVLRSGTQRRRVTDRSVFLRTWARSDNWALVALRPGELPAGDDPDGYLGALAAAEATGRLAVAAAGYRAALTRWPDNRLARLGLANIAFAEEELAVAEAQYRALLATDPADLVAMNNLAETLALAGRRDEARRMIERALALAGSGHPLTPVLRETAEGLAGDRPTTAQD
ncbi:MAG: PA2778 family cysteine peptidase [Gammaproteobacteria bacterium]